MRVVALEEHFTYPAAVKRVDPAVANRNGFKVRKAAPGKPSMGDLLPEIGEVRLKSMDDAGITVQVLSHSGVGPDLVPGPDGVAMAREINDYLAGVVAKKPDRFAGFATLPMASPDACAAELQRSIKDLHFVRRDGSTAPDRRPLPRSSELRRPARRGREARPGSSPTSIGPAAGACHPADLLLRSAGGRRPRARHRGLGLASGDRDPCCMRMALAMAGTFDKHPKLKMIIGHMGEMLPVMLARIDQTSSLDRDHLKRRLGQAGPSSMQVWITNSGIFTQPPMIAALQTFGIDRIMFSVDYPFARDAQGRAFLDEIALACRRLT